MEQVELETRSLMEYCARVRPELHTFTMDEKRRVLEMLGIMVVWHPDRKPEMRGSISVEEIASYAIRCDAPP